MRIVFCGSGSFAVPTLQALAQGHDVAAVITQPARPAGRGGKVRPTPVAEAAGELGLNIHEVRSINKEDALAAVGQARPDVIVVADFGQFLRKPVRDLARIDSINLHGSLLPALRGAAPINWALINGLERTGVTTFSLVDAMDAGRTYASMGTPIGPDDTAADLRARLAGIGAQAVLQTLDLLEREGTAAGRDQDESMVTLAPPLKKTDGLVDWSAGAREICNRIRGVWPWPGAQSGFVHHQRCVAVTVARAQPLDDAEPGFQSGQLDSDLCVTAGAGRVQVLEIQPTGKRLMSWRDFVNGYRCRKGDMMITPGMSI